MSQNQDYVEAGKVDEISNGQMKHVEINGVFLQPTSIPLN